MDAKTLSENLSRVQAHLQYEVAQTRGLRVRVAALEAENERLREALATIYEATADLLDHVTGMSETEPTPIFEAAERALAHAAELLHRTVHEP